jgi:hypothetical protein
MQSALLTFTLTPLTLVAEHALLLPPYRLKLNEYAPMWSALNDPPYEFAPCEMSSVVVTALQPIHGASLTTTLTLLTFVSPVMLLLLTGLSDMLPLQAYAPM